MPAQPGGVAEADLDSFFPFDPCQLPLTSRHIDPIFQTWQGFPGESDDEEDSDEEDEEEEDEEVSEEDVPAEGEEDKLGYRIPQQAAKRVTARGGARKTSGGGRPLQAGLSYDSVEDAEVQMLGKSMEGAMSISPGLGLAGRMGMQPARATGAAGGGKEVRWV